MQHEIDPSFFEGRDQIYNFNLKGAQSLMCWIIGGNTLGTTVSASVDLSIGKFSIEYVFRTWTLFRGESLGS